MGIWRNFTLTAPGLPGITPGNDIACVSRMPGHVETFYIAEDGSVWDYFWYGQWGNRQLRPPGSAVMGGITAVSRRKQSIMLFWISSSGSIESGVWEEGADWKWWQIHPPGTAAIHTKLVSLTRHSENVELFFMGKNGSVEGTAWNGSGWPRSQIAPDGSAVVMFSGLTAVTRRSEAMEVWWVSPKGSVEGAWRWDTNPKWNRYQVAPDGSAAVEGANLRAHARLPDIMNMWWISPRGSVEGCWSWVDKVPWSRYQIAGDGSANTNGDIFSLHRYGWLTEEIWWIRKDGAIMDAYWYDGMDKWNVFELAPPGSAKPFGSIYGASRDIGVMDIFYERMDGKVQSYWFEFKRKDFAGNPTSGGLAALGGWCNLTLTDDGVIRWNGDAHNSGMDDYDYSLVGYCNPRAGSGMPQLLSVNHGHVKGHIIGNSGRDNPWYEIRRNGILITNFDDYANGSFWVSTEYSSSLEKTFLGLINLGIKAALGAVIGGAAMFIFVGAEVVSLAMTGNLSAGARIVNGVLYMAGPENTLIAIVAGAVASIGSRDRQITQDEYNWANEQVFKGTLPPREKIYLTDTKGKDNRAFTIPQSGGRISINVGGYSGFYENPRDPNYASTFLHELTHAWQIKYAGVKLALLTQALSNQLKGSAAYVYGPAGPPFKDFNMEQQAQIVQDWWSGGENESKRKSNSRMAQYNGYIEGNIRTGVS